MWNGYKFESNWEMLPRTMSMIKRASEIGSVATDEMSILIIAPNTETKTLYGRTNSRKAKIISIT